jgi:hypothetical protein
LHPKPLIFPTIPKDTSNNQPLLSLHAGTGFSNVPGEETSPCQEEEETHLPCTVRIHNNNAKDTIQRFTERFSMTPFKHLRKNESNARISMTPLDLSLWIQVS